MNEHYHAIVWIDHREAKIFFVGARDAESFVIQAHGAGRHLQHKANTTGSGHRGVDREFFERVIHSLSDAGAILLTGPGHARLELKNYMTEHHPALANHIAAVEALDHPHDATLLDLARKFFRADDRMHAQIP